MWHSSTKKFYGPHRRHFQVGERIIFCKIFWEICSSPHNGSNPQLPCCPLWSSTKIMNKDKGKELQWPRHVCKKDGLLAEKQTNKIPQRHCTFRLHLVLAFAIFKSREWFRPKMDMVKEQPNIICAWEAKFAWHAAKNWQQQSAIYCWKSVTGRMRFLCRSFLYRVDALFALGSI